MNTIIYMLVMLQLQQLMLEQFYSIPSYVERFANHQEEF